MSEHAAAASCLAAPDGPSCGSGRTVLGHDNGDPRCYVVEWRELMLVRTNSFARRMLNWWDSQASARETLGVDASATSETIRRAYLELVQVWHPDRFEHDPILRQQAEIATKRINEAYRTLYRARRARPRLGRRSRPSRAHGPFGRAGADSRSERRERADWTLSPALKQASIVVLTVLLSVVASLALVYVFLLFD